MLTIIQKYFSSCLFVVSWTKKAANNPFLYYLTVFNVAHEPILACMYPVQNTGEGHIKNIQMFHSVVYFFYIT